MNTKAKFGVGTGIILISLSALAWLGARESKTYYHTIAELPSLKGAAARQHMRIGGTVAPGSIAHLQGRVDFVLEGEGKSLPVSYVGTDPLPDTFVDNSQALIEGHAAPDGRFVADKVQAKCASKYEADPGQQKPANSSGATDKRS
jgi:cytochrome c-type biogenesis protein CcmE